MMPRTRRRSSSSSRNARGREAPSSRGPGRYSRADQILLGDEDVAFSEPLRCLLLDLDLGQSRRAQKPTRCSGAPRASISAQAGQPRRTHG